MKTPPDYFATLHDLVQYVDSLPYEGTLDPSHVAFSLGSHADAKQLATYGWPEGAKMASAAVTKIANRILETTGASVYQVIEYDVIGAAYDAGAVALGMPESWGVMAPQVAKRAVKLVLNVSASAGVPSEVLVRRGIAVTALVLALQARGYPVTVDIMQYHDRGRTQTTVTLIDAGTGSQLDIDRLVFGIAHPTVYRRLLRAVTNGVQCDGFPRHNPWNASPSDATLTVDADLYLGSVHLSQVERWQDGGENWIMQEYLKQTGA